MTNKVSAPGIGNIKKLTYYAFSSQHTYEANTVLNANVLLLETLTKIFESWLQNIRTLGLSWITM